MYEAFAAHRGGGSDEAPARDALLRELSKSYPQG